MTTAASTRRLRPRWRHRFPTPSRRRPGITALVAVVAFLLADTLGAGIAAAQTTPAPSPTFRPATAPSRFALAAQSPWTPAGGEVGFAFTLADAPADASISLAVYPAITSRKQYDLAAQGGPLTSVLGQVSVPLDTLGTGATGARTLTVGLQSATDARDPAKLNVRRPGVYPVDVELRDGTESTVASFRTMLVVTEADRATVAEPLRVAWVWPITEPPSFLPDGQPDREVLASFRANGRLGRMATALDAVPGVPVTLAPTGETIEAWSAAAAADPTVQAGYAALQLGLAGRAVLDGGYLPVDLPALLDHDLVEAVDDVLARGADVIDSTLGVPADARTRLLRPASATALGRLTGAGVDRVVVPSEALTPIGEPRFTPALPVNLTAPVGLTPGAPVTALATDPGLQSILTADLPAAQRVQLLLGAMSVVALETPSIPRVVTLANPDDFDPPPELYRALLQGLQGNPLLAPVTTTQAFDSVPADPPGVLANGQPGSSQRELAAVTAAEPTVTALEYRNQRRRLASFGALTRAGDPAFAAADRSLLASVASGWAPDVVGARTDAHLAVVDGAIADLVSKIEVPDPRTITLTSRSGEIPLTFRNETGHPLRLRAALASEKLFFPEGSVIELELPPKSTTVRVAVEARTSGTFPLDLEVTSTDGVLSISQRRLEVRSTFVSTVGWILMGSAVAFLAVWWGIDLRRRRRRRQPSTT